LVYVVQHLTENHNSWFKLSVLVSQVAMFTCHK